MPQEKRIIFLGSRRLRRQPLCHWSTGNDDVPGGGPLKCRLGKTGALAMLYHEKSWHDFSPLIARA